MAPRRGGDAMKRLYNEVTLKLKPRTSVKHWCEAIQEIEEHKKVTICKNGHKADSLGERQVRKQFMHSDH